MALQTFGYTGADGPTSTNIEDTIIGGHATIPEDGIAVSITARITISTAAKNVKCALYKASDFSFVAETEERNISVTSATEETFEFSGEPELTEGTEYIICVWSSTAGGLAAIHLKTSGGDMNLDSQAYNGWPTPMSETNLTWLVDIYCTYDDGEEPENINPKVKIAGTFATKVTKVKIGGNFAEKPVLVKVGGTFQ